MNEIISSIIWNRNESLFTLINPKQYLLINIFNLIKRLKSDCDGEYEGDGDGDDECEDEWDVILISLWVILSDINNFKNLESMSSGVDDGNGVDDGRLIIFVILTFK